MNNLSEKRFPIDLVEEGIPGLVALMVYSWRIITAGLVGGVLVGVILGQVLEDQYEAAAVIVSSSQFGGSSGVGNLAGLASAATQFGIDIGGGESDPSFLFPWILRSREVSDRILTHKYTDSDDRMATLVDRIVDADIPHTRQLDRARRKLHRDILRYEQDRRSGVSEVKVRANDPVLAAEVANVCLGELDRYYLELRSQFTGGEYAFLESRMNEVEEDLKDAEDDYLAFTEENRDIGSSPELKLRRERLMRKLQLTEQLYLSLHTQADLSRIEREKSLPVIAVIETGYPPAFPVAPKSTRLTLLFGLVGTFIAAVFVLTRNAFASNRMRVRG